MSNFKKLSFNITTSLLNKLISIISGLLISREVLFKFGEEMFGLVSSIRNIIGYLGLLEIGLSGSVLYLLYQHFSKCEYPEIKFILNYLKKKYKFVGSIYTIILVFLAIIYSLTSLSFVKSNIDIFLLVISLGSIKVIDFYLVAKYRVLLLADQKDYINNICSIVQIIIFTTLALLILHNNMNLYYVYGMLVPSNLIRYTLIKFYWEKIYGKNIKNTNTSLHVVIDQQVSVVKFELLWLVLSTYVILVLTLNESFKEIAYFGVQFMIFGNLIMMIQLINSGITPTYGNILNINIDVFKIKIKQYQYLIFGSSIFFGIIGIISIGYFIQFYVPNEDYRQFIDFDLTMSLFAFVCFTTIRIFYSSIIGIKGLYNHFRYLTYIIILFLLIASLLPISLKSFHLVWTLVIANIIIIISFIIKTNKLFIAGSQSKLLIRTIASIFLVIITNYITHGTEFYLGCNLVLMLLLLLSHKQTLLSLYEYINSRLRGFN